MLLVLPYAAAYTILETPWWALNMPQIAIWAVSLSILFGLVAWKTQSATPLAAASGTAITACLMYSTINLPYEPWRTALIPVLAVLLLTSIATRIGRRGKEQMGTAENRQGRTASQVAANLGIAALASNDLLQSWLIDKPWFSHAVTIVPMLLFTISLAALAEAAADTVSSEMGQVLCRRPRMITTLREVQAGTGGAISLAGTLCGAVAAAIIALAGSLALSGGITMFWIATAGGVFGLLFDSLLGATLERRDWLNNDAVNFLSAASAAGIAIALLAILPLLGAK